MNSNARRQSASHLSHSALAPLALYASVAGAERIAAVCERAHGEGLAVGLGLAEARARFPHLDLLVADPAADRRLLEAIADWCDRYTPLVAIEAPQGLILDISGCAHLFGGERALAADLLKRLFAQGFAGTAAIAGHAATASALVAGAMGQRGSAPFIVEEGAERQAVESLPTRALRLDGDLSAMLGRLGLTTIGTLLSLPRASLARRFGPLLLARLDEAAGLSRRPISPRLAVPALIAERRFAEPIGQIEDILRIVLFLAERLKEALERRGEGARRLELVLFRIDGAVERIGVATSAPIRSPERIGALFRERFKAPNDERDAGFGYDLVRLCVFEAETMADRQEDLSGEEPSGTDLGGLIDRIGARLGPASVVTFEALESHWPENAVRSRPASGMCGSPQIKALDKGTGAEALRPVRLLGRPELVEAAFEVPDGVPMHFRWRRALHRVRRFEGPERIASEWWRAQAEETRDYYRVEDAEGRRYWLFRKGSEDEVPDDRTTEPVASWYLHGIFA